MTNQVLVLITKLRLSHTFTYVKYSLFCCLMVNSTATGVSLGLYECMSAVLPQPAIQCMSAVLPQPAIRIFSHRVLSACSVKLPNDHDCTAVYYCTCIGCISPVTIHSTLVPFSTDSNTSILIFANTIYQSAIQYCSGCCAAKWLTIP